MARICDICGGTIGFKAFHCLDGMLCKNCYRIVSNQFTTTITGSTLLDLKMTYIKNAAPIDLGSGGFRITKKIGTFLFLDEQHKKFCIPSNQKITGQYTRPKIYRFGELSSYKLVADPPMPPEKLATLSENKRNSVIVKKLCVRLRMKNGNTRDVVVIPSPVRSSSYAFRKSYQIAMDLLRDLDYINHNT